MQIVFFADIPRFPVIQHDKSRQNRVPPTGQLFHRGQRNPGIWTESTLTPTSNLRIQSNNINPIPTPSQRLPIWFPPHKILLTPNQIHTPSLQSPYWNVERPNMLTESPKDNIIVWPVNLPKRKLCFSRGPVHCYARFYTRTKACLNPIKEIVVMVLILIWFYDVNFGSFLVLKSLVWRCPNLSIAKLKLTSNSKDFQ